MSVPPSQSRGVVLAKTLVFTVLVPGTVTVLLPYWILSASGGLRRPEPGVASAAGALLILAGVAIYLSCVWDFAGARGTPAPIDPPKELVARGLYRFTRNPMYVGVVTLLSGEALCFGSLRLLGYAALVLGMFHLFVVAYEEPTLRGEFGEAYARYCARVPRWPLPRVPRR